MAEYYPLLAKAVANLKDSTPETRRSIYERAGKALLAQLGKADPPISSEDIQREQTALTAAAERVEAEISAKSVEADLAGLFPSKAEASSPRPTPPPVSRPVPRPAPPRPMPAAGGVAPLPPPPLVRPPSPRPPTPRPPAPMVSRPRLETPPPPPPPMNTHAPAAVAPPPRAPRPIEPPPPPAMASAFEPPASVEAEFNESAAGKGFFRSFGRARVEAGAEPAMVGMAESDPFEPKAEALRSAAPTPPRTHSFNRRTGIFAVALLVIFAVMAAVAIKFRDKPEDFVRARPAASTEANEPSAGKIGGRAGEPITNAPAPATPSPTATAAAPAAPSVPVAQRAALLIEAPDEPNKVKTYVGTVVWSLTPGADGLPSLQAQVDIPDAKLSVSVVMTKNTNDALSASNRIAVRFKPSADGPVTGIKQIASPEMRGEDRPQGDALTGLPAQVTPNYFWIALAKDDLIMSRNMTLMRDRGWFDLPLLLDNDKIAKITVEKGAGGDQLLRQALAAWGQ